MSVTTFYPAAGANSPVDGRTAQDANADTWANTIAAAGNYSNSTAASDVATQGESFAAKYNLSRLVFLFDTSVIGTDTVDSATLSLYSTGAGDTSEATNPANLALVSSNPTSSSSLANSDYAVAKWGSTRLSTDVTLAVFVATSQYHAFALNASGLANINKTGISKFGIRPSNDLDNLTPTARSYGFGYYADQAGTANDPKLVVTHSAAGGGLPIPVARPYTQAVNRAAVY